MNPPRTDAGPASNGPPAAPTPAPRAIFRREAMQHYVHNQSRVVLPRLVTPRAFRLLWVLGFLTLAGGLLVAFWPWRDLVPVLLQGSLP